MRNITLFIFLNNPDQTTDIIVKEQQDYLERTLTKRRRERRKCSKDLLEERRTIDL
jgi:hypothetical protein